MKKIILCLFFKIPYPPPLPLLSKKMLKSEQGFSLVGVLVASTIGFVVLMGIVESMGNISKSVRKGNQAISVAELRKDIMRIAMKNVTHTSQESSCTNTLKGVKTNGHSKDQDSDIHSYTFPEEGVLKKSGVAPGPDSPYKVYKDDSDNSDVYFGSLIIKEIKFKKDVPSPAPATNVVADTGRLYVTYLDKNRSYIQFEDLTPLIVEDIHYDSDNETIASCSFRLDARTVVDCFTAKANGLTLVGCGSTQSITRVETVAYGYNITDGIVPDPGKGLFNSFFGYETAKNNKDGSNNSFFGYKAGHTNSAGSDNSFFGYLAGHNNTANGNSFFGSQAGHDNTTGGNNTFVGHFAGHKNTASNNSFFGFEVAKNNSSGAGNSFFGYQAGLTNTTGSGNTFVGSSAGHKNTASNNSFFGFEVAKNNSSGAGNSFFGSQAGHDNTTGANNTFVGSSAGYKNTASNNSFFGFEAAKNNSSGAGNSFFGYQAGLANTIGSGNTFIGSSAGHKNTADGNSFFGYYAGRDNVSGAHNTFVGYLAGQKNTADGNSFFGFEVAKNNTSGKYNSFFGSQAGRANIAGKDNTFLGHSAGYESKSDSNTFVGSYAGYKTVSGAYNVFIGAQSGLLNETGKSNTYVGDNSGRYGKNTLNNTFVGYLAGYNSKDSYNVFVGSGSGSSMDQNGRQNTYIGFRSGHYIKKGSSNIMIGSYSSFGHSPNPCPAPCNTLGEGSNNIYIGHKKASKTHNNEIRIGNKKHTSLHMGVGAFGLESRLGELKIGRLIHIDSDPVPSSDPNDPSSTPLISIQKDSNPTPNSIRIGDSSFSEVMIAGVDIIDMKAKVDSFVSSKTLKKNIIPFENYEMALQDIVEMPLSTYQYKENHPDHTRRGFIAEDLPSHMQLPQEEGSDLVKPDWATIWGTFWASIKALAIKFDSLKKEISVRLAEFAGHLSDLKSSLADLTKNFSLFQSEITKTASDLKAENEELKRELASVKRDIAEIKTILKKEKRSD